MTTSNIGYFNVVGIIAPDNTPTRLYVVIDNKYTTAVLDVAALAKLNGRILNAQVEKNGEVKFINGKKERYGEITGDNRVIRPSSAVVLDRIEKNGDLIGYTIYNVHGMVEQVTVEAAVNMHKKGLIANSKIRELDNGKLIIQSIVNQYPVREISVKDVAMRAAETGEPKIVVSIELATKAIMAETKESLTYYGVIISCSSGAVLSSIAKELQADNKAVVDKLLSFGEEERIKGNGSLAMVSNGGVYGLISDKYLSSLLGNKLVTTNKQDKTFIASYDLYRVGSGNTVNSYCTYKLESGQVKVISTSTMEQGYDPLELAKKVATLINVK